jgi:hypothetical protein
MVGRNWGVLVRIKECIMQLSYKQGTTSIPDNCCNFY